MQFVKHIIFSSAFALFFYTCIAQNGTLKHTIKGGESLSLIAKKYHTTVGDIMRANSMNAKSILKIGQVIVVPSKHTTNVVVTEPLITEKAVTPPTTTNISTVSSPATNGTKHTVQAKESLYSIARKYKVTVTQIKEWNNLTTDVIKVGQELIVSAQESSKVVVTPPIEKDPMPNVTEKAAPAEVKTANPPQVSNPIPTPAPKQDTVKVSAPIKQENKPTIVEQAPSTVKEAEPIKSNQKFAATEGFFASYFDRKNIDKNTISGDASTFKSISGWSDKKYYILTNNIEAGTIVRITTSGKSICAKVLNALPDIKEDNGLVARINNAAAAALGLPETGKFAITLNF